MTPNQAQVHDDLPLRSPKGSGAMSKEARRLMRYKRDAAKKKEKQEGSETGVTVKKQHETEKLVQFLSKNEDELLEFVVNVDKLYKDKLKKEAPFMTFVLVGMQSSGKSTFMERLLNAVVNIVQEGTGTRCPLDVTCVHDDKCRDAEADLSGDELDRPGTNLSADEVFERITEHSKMLADEDRFSTQSLKLVYRARNVQNMRFVDTPGIISNQSTGKDNREDIKNILRTEIARANTRLCVLLEATEYAKNPVINFLDESLDGRSGWIDQATFLMTKFDKQMEDSRTVNKANNFFSEFINNGVHPHLVITPTLDREDLSASELFAKRNDLLDKANRYEEGEFKNWLRKHEQFRQSDGNDDFLTGTIQARIGFPVAQTTMRKQMLEHTLETLPAVIDSIQNDLQERLLKLQDLKEKQKFCDPVELKGIVKDMLHLVQQRVAAYLDGDLISAIKYRDQLQTLDDEIEKEEDSDWVTKELNFYTEKEDKWRDHMAEMKEYPKEIQPHKPFLGGKQVHRAIEFFRAVMIDSLPDPWELAELVPNAAGYGHGGLMRENWEGATKQICMVLMQDVTHPGINYLVKHIGYILRRLFLLALEDIKEGQEFSKTFRLVPGAVEVFLVDEFDKMLWGLMQNAADNIHTALEPLYSTIDPNLPTFHTEDDAAKQDSASSEESDGIVMGAVKRLSAALTGSGTEAKKIMQEENRARAETKKSFLRDERTSMITDEETEMILKRSFQYLVALMEFSLVLFRLQVNFFLYEKFKTEMQKSFIHKGSEANWSELVVPDPSIPKEIAALEDQISGLRASLQEVQRMYQKL